MTEHGEESDNRLKRHREEDDGVPDMPPADVEDSSDEKIGPMPVPDPEGSAVKVSNGRRKKRASA